MTPEFASTVRIERKPKLSEHVVSVIKAQILSGEVPPGGKLPTESQMTKVFGVSRTVVREAVAALAADGLVESRQGAGVFVRETPASTFGLIGLEIGNRISQALNMLELRMGLEIESAGLASQRRNSAQLAGIQETFFEFDRLLDLGEPTGGADFAFHRSIAVATNNPFYVEVLDALGARIIPCDVTSSWSADFELSRDYQEGLQREHLSILEAIANGDAEAARTAMRNHLGASQNRYRQRLSGQQAEYYRHKPGRT